MHKRLTILTLHMHTIHMCSVGTRFSHLLLLAPTILTPRTTPILLILPILILPITLIPSLIHTLILSTLNTLSTLMLILIPVPLPDPPLPTFSAPRSNHHNLPNPSLLLQHKPLNPYLLPHNHLHNKHNHHK